MDAKKIKEIEELVSSWLLTYVDGSFDSMWEDLEKDVDEEILDRIVRMVRYRMEYAIYDIVDEIEEVINDNESD